MSGAPVTITTLANWIPEHWSNKTQDAVEFARVVGKRVNDEYEGEIKSMGDIVNITGLSNYTANTKSANTEVVFEAFTHPTQQLAIDKHQYAAIRVEKIARVQAMPGYQERQSKKMGYALARAQEVALTALFDGFGDNGTIGTLGLELADSDYRTAWQKLAEAGVMEEGESNDEVSLILSPAAIAAALSIEKYTSRDFGAESDAITRAAIGMLYGAQVFMSNLLEADAAGQHDCAMFHRNALTLAVQAAPTFDQDKVIEHIATAIVCDVIYGVKELTRPGESAANVTLTDNYGVYLATV